MDEKDIPDGAYGSIRGGENARGQPVNFCYGKNKNSRGVFVGWRETGARGVYFQRDQVIKHRALETLILELNNRAQVSREKSPPKQPLTKEAAAVILKLEQRNKLKHKKLTRGAKGAAKRRKW